MRRHQDLVISRGESEAHASESSSQSLERADTTSGHRYVGGSSSGGGSRNEGEAQRQKQLCAHFLSGPSDGFLLNSLKDHVALVIWSNEILNVSINTILKTYVFM
ncbi:hypothetical protein Syun_023175 [Stephania yunnanensis]|uniref:Uncharacterized protein n=1 Tax=Stephania yunnanensis TaxID=152371 RepID=A0AAP0F950_9MAGN